MEWETPEERQQRLDKMEAYTKTNEELRRAKRRALKDQSQEVQQLVRLQDMYGEWRFALDITFENILPVDEDGVPEGALPATVDAWRAAYAALDRLYAEMGREIAVHWGAGG